MPWLSPRAKREMTTIRANKPAIEKLILRCPRKLIPGFTNILRDAAVANVSLLKDLLFANQKKNRRLRYTAVKKEQIRPMIRVVAKPLMGPVPKSSRITPVITDVRFESKIAEKAFE